MVTQNRNLERKLELSPVSKVNEVVEQNPSVTKTELMSVKRIDVNFLKEMRKLVLVLTFVATGFCAKAQLNITSNGKVGIGRNPVYKFEVGGEAKFSAGWMGLIIGWSSDNYCPAIYSEYNNYLWLGRPDRWINHIWTYQIDYQNITKYSDLRLKENIEYCSSILPKIQQIQTYTFNYNDIYFRDFTSEQKQKAQRKEFGFIAQEFEKIFPELVYAPDSLREYYGIDYVSLIPLLVEAIKEQQIQIESLQKMLAECCSSKNNPTQKRNTFINDNEEGIKNEVQKGKLYDNVPNPFNMSTEIKFEIPDNTASAQLMICNLNGVELKSYKLNQKGIGSITIQGSEFAAGIYLYTLLINNQIVDTKKMVLTK
ncbi:MAG: tail fiber domain-containing protein [Bacteroidales bacterium]|nr:tail fiber domain-containing protein [Bacteroidales bacterium]